MHVSRTYSDISEHAGGWSQLSLIRLCAGLAVVACTSHLGNHANDVAGKIARLVLHGLPTCPSCLRGELSPDIMGRFNCLGTCQACFVRCLLPRLCDDEQQISFACAGAWVGGMFTTLCLNHLAVKGYPLTIVSPGNKPAEIISILTTLKPAQTFSQTIIFGYRLCTRHFTKRMQTMQVTAVNPDPLLCVMHVLTLSCYRP
jgi:hypothetical protein